MNEYNVLKSINKLIRDNFTKLKYVEIISPNTKIDKNYFLKKDEDLHNKSETSIFPLVYSFCGFNEDIISGVNIDVSNSLLFKNDLYIHLLILTNSMKDFLTIPDEIREFLNGYKTSNDYYLPITDYTGGVGTVYSYISSDITINTFSDILKTTIDEKYIKLSKEMVFTLSFYKEY